MQALLHAGLGAWLQALADAERQQQQQQQEADEEAPSATALPTPLLWCGRMAVAFGSLVVVLLVSRHTAADIAHQCFVGNDVSAAPASRCSKFSDV